MDRFERILEGAHFMDEHFRTAPLEENVRFLFIGLVHKNKQYLVDSMCARYLSYCGKI